MSEQALFAIANELNMQNRIQCVKLLYENCEYFTEDDLEEKLNDILDELEGNR